MSPHPASEIRLMTKTQLEKFNKGALVDCLLTLIKDGGSTFESLEKKLDEKFNAIHAEIVELKNTIVEKNQLIENLTSRLDKQDDIIKRQQRNLEALDRERRENRLVVTGIPEEEALEGQTTDENKLKVIWNALGTEVKPRSFNRIGKEIAGRKRPLLITLDSRTDRDRILEKKVELKKNENLKLVYVKKDVHPNVREEWRRLFEAEKAEKERPENAGADIRIDMRKRELLRDGVVIDKWNPSPF